jgi:hypothetical protein
VSQRPAIVTIEEEADGSDVRVTIALDWQGREFHGSAVGEAGGQHTSRLVGEATLRAVEHLCSDRVDLELLAVAAQDLGPIRVALAQVRMNRDETLVGTAVLTSDGAPLAAARAVMDAINRKLGLIVQEASAPGVNPQR